MDLNTWNSLSNADKMAYILAEKTARLTDEDTQTKKHAFYEAMASTFGQFESDTNDQLKLLSATRASAKADLVAKWKAAEADGKWVIPS